MISLDYFNFCAGLELKILTIILLSALRNDLHVLGSGLGKDSPLFVFYVSLDGNIKNKNVRSLPSANSFISSFCKALRKTSSSLITLTILSWSLRIVKLSDGFCKHLGVDTIIKTESKSKILSCGYSFSLTKLKS